LINKNTLTLLELIQKLEYYCSYQERCHFDVETKLKSLTTIEIEINTVIVHLIENNFLNEERFANLFSISKFHQKYWGEKRITAELKARKISAYLINNALKNIPEDEYLNTFNTVAIKHWNSIKETEKYKKRKKFCDYLIRKGFEQELIYNQLKSLENAK